MNPCLDRSQPLPQGGCFAIGRDHEKGSQPLQKHCDHRRLHTAGQIVEGLDLLENRIKLRRRDKICRALRTYVCQSGTDDRNTHADFFNELVVESVEFS